MGRAVSDLRVGKLTIVLYWSSCRPGGVAIRGRWCLTVDWWPGHGKGRG